MVMLAFRMSFVAWRNSLLFIVEVLVMRMVRPGKFSTCSLAMKRWLLGAMALTGYSRASVLKHPALMMAALGS